MSRFLGCPHGILKNTLTLRSVPFLLIIAATIHLCALSAHGQINVLAAKKETLFRSKIKDSECKPLIAENTTNSVITIERIETGAWSDLFELNDVPNLPRKLAPGESANLGYICFRPVVADKEYGASIRVITSPQLPGGSEISFHGVSLGEAKVNTVPATAVGAVIALDPSKIKEGALISMIGHDFNFMRSYSFKNTGSVSYLVTNIDFENIDHQFDVLGIEPDVEFPFEVPPGESFSVRFAYHTTDRVPHTNTLLIATSESKEPIKYEIRGLALPLSEMEWNKKAQK